MTAGHADVSAPWLGSGVADVLGLLNLPSSILGRFQTYASGFLIKGETTSKAESITWKKLPSSAVVSVKGND